MKKQMPGPAQYAEVAPAIPLTARSRQTYTYGVPPGADLAVYDAVRVPFGPQVVPGVVVSLSRTKPRYQVKQLTVPHSLPLTVSQAALARWISHTMQGGLGYTMRLFLPPGRLASLKQHTRARRVAAPQAASPSRSKQPRLTAAAKVIQESLPSRLVGYVENDRSKRVDTLLRLAGSYTRRHKQALIVVPERWMADEFAAQAAANGMTAVAAFHTGKAVSEQQAVWRGVGNGTISIVIGTQKALFLPYADLGLVCVEEEQYQTHKLWDQYPRLHNRRTGLVLADIHHAHTMVSSSFPSLWWRAKVADGSLVQVGEPPAMPATVVAGLTLEDRRRHYLFPNSFIYQLQQWVKRKESILLLHNRRGMWRAALCRTCHTPLRCRSCALAYAVSGSAQRRVAQCHYCGIRKAFPATCPACHKGRWKFVGIGAEKVAQLLSEVLPKSTKLVQIDAGVLAKKTDKQKEQLIHDARVLLGTSAVLPYIPSGSRGRVIWLFPENTLSFPDFRSEEQAQALVARLSSLTASQRRVWLVTRQPEFVERVLGSGAAASVASQLKERKALKYPPYHDLVRLTTEAKTTAAAVTQAEAVRRSIEKRAGAGPLVIRGPYTSFAPPQRGKSEAHLLLSGTLADVVQYYDRLPVQYVDVDPQRIT